VWQTLRTDTSGRENRWLDFPKSRLTIKPPQTEYSLCVE
jgi:hypothetical protein